MRLVGGTPWGGGEDPWGLGHGGKIGGGGRSVLGGGGGVLWWERLGLLSTLCKQPVAVA